MAEKNKITAGLFSRKQVLLIIAIIIPLVLVWVLFIEKNHRWDRQLIIQLSRLEDPTLTRIMRGISFLGNHLFLIPASLILIFFLIFSGKKKEALQSMLVILSSLGLMSLLKNLFQRVRPEDPLVAGINNYSFPSGHAFMGMAFYGTLFWLAGKYIPQPGTRRFLEILLVLLILLIGFSRLYLRVHFPSDVLAGYCIGGVWLWACLGISDKIRIR